MSKMNNRQAICNILLEKAKKDKDIIVACSDSRGSGAMTPFFNQYPAQSVEVGIAEQDLVGISAGLAACGKKVFAISPASFLTTRSYEQCKVDVAYSHTNVTLVGISGGISYGALGMTHHSCQDFAAMAALTDMRVYVPCDQYETSKLIAALLEDEDPSYVRVSRSASEDVYDENMAFTLNKANVLSPGKDVLLVACGQMVTYAKKAAKILNEKGISTGCIDMYCLKPLDTNTLLEMAKDVKLVVTIEEHAPSGGLGSLVAQCLSFHCPKRVLPLTLPDTHMIPGEDKEVFAYYGLDTDGIVRSVEETL